MDHFVVVTLQNNKLYYYVKTKNSGAIVWATDVRESKKFETRGSAEIYAVNHGVRKFTVKWI